MLANIQDSDCRNNEFKTAQEIVKKTAIDQNKAMIAHYERILSNWASADKNVPLIASRQEISVPILSNIDKSVYEQWRETFEGKKYKVVMTDRLFTVSLP